MGASVDRLTGLISDPKRFDIPFSELRDVQIEAIDERFQERKEVIKLLGHRAHEAGLSKLRSREDIVQILFPHTAYKSYPANFLIDERWDRLTKWIATVSSHPIKDVDLNDITDVDDWIARLSSRGYFIACSSGTTGNPAILIASQKDMDWSKVDTINVFSWGSGVMPARNRMMFGCAPVATTTRSCAIGDAQYAAFANPEWPRFRYPVPPITVGSLTKMLAMRKRIADGTARPEEIAAFEATSKERQEVLDRAIGSTAEQIIANRDKLLMVSGLWSGLYAVAKAVSDRGYGGKDFHPDNCAYVAGGLKRAQLPPDYKEFVFRTFNVPHDHNFQNYSMQELNSGMPKCRAGNRYHVPPWIVPMILNKEGDALVHHDHGEVEGRAGFFDLSLEGRWGGVITGDKVWLDLRPCACGNKGPSIRDNIARYADLEGDDKIGCAGTVDAYVRGVA